MVSLFLVLCGSHCGCEIPIKKGPRSCSSIPPPTRVMSPSRVLRTRQAKFLENTNFRPEGKVNSSQPRTLSLPPPTGTPCSIGGGGCDTLHTLPSPQAISYTWRIHSYSRFFPFTCTKSQHVAIACLHSSMGAAAPPSPRQGGGRGPHGGGARRSPGASGRPPTPLPSQGGPQGLTTAAAGHQEGVSAGQGLRREGWWPQHAGQAPPPTGPGPCGVDRSLGEKTSYLGGKGDVDDVWGTNCCHEHPNDCPSSLRWLPQLLVISYHNLEITPEIPLLLHLFACLQRSLGASCVCFNPLGQRTIL